jgi:coenzyme PQQ precursor peptide PqqA
MTTLSGKTALVTGASRGLGRASALALAKAGAQVLVHYGSGAKEAEAVVAEIRKGGGRVALATPRGSPTSPRAAPNARGFFCIRPRSALFVSKRGITTRVAESSRRVPHQRDSQTRRRNDAMAWSTPEIREVCVGMEVTSYLSAEM